LKARVLVAALLAVAAAALLMRGAGRGAAWAPNRPSAPSRVAARPAIVSRPLPARRTPIRNIFEYADDRRGPAAALPAPPREAYVAPEAPLPSPSPAVRVAGLVRRGAELKAALVVEGEVTVAGKGERAGGYTVLNVDDETGVRLRGPAGEEMLLPPPPF
jgi:hypothetical protein